MTDTQRQIFEHRSVMPTTMERMLAFHQAPRALAILTPPPIFVQVIRDDRTALTAGELEFKLWFGPLPVHWVAQHEPGPTANSFIDRVIAGPVDYWEHQHIFREVPGGVELTDRITLTHKSGGFWGIFTRLFFGALPLRFLFFYRHLRTRLAVKQ